MKWFIVVIGTLPSGQPHHAVDWRYPYNTRAQCEAEIKASRYPIERWAEGRFVVAVSPTDHGTLYCEQIGEQ